MDLEEVKDKILNATSVEEIKSLTEEYRNKPEEEKVEEPKVEEPKVEEPKVEEPQEEPKKEEVTEEEERSLMAGVETSDITNLRKISGGIKMEEKKFDLKSPEYRSAWAKKVMGLSDDKFTEDEKRALGDAVTTTATTYVASASDVQGINNGGLFIPETVRMELMGIIEQMSPWFRDIRKLSVNGNVDLPYLYAADDANWYAELTDTVNEGAEYKNLQLTGWELAKDIVITWKAEEMAVESFISFILEELAHKMGVALITATIYGNGSNKPTGVLNGLNAVTDGETPIDNIIATYQSLDQEARRGAKVYVSTAVKIAMIGYKDENGNYPFLQGINGTDLFTIETEPFLDNNDVIVGNPRYYILNTNTPMRIDRESTIKGRKVTYGAYGIYDGKAKPGAFAKGSYTPVASL